MHHVRQPKQHLNLPFRQFPNLTEHPLLFGVVCVEHRAQTLVDVNHTTSPQQLGKLNEIIGASQQLLRSHELRPHITAFPDQLPAVRDVEEEAVDGALHVLQISHLLHRNAMRVCCGMGF